MLSGKRNLKRERVFGLANSEDRCYSGLLLSSYRFRKTVWWKGWSIGVHHRNSSASASESGSPLMSENLKIHCLHCNAFLEEWFGVLQVKGIRTCHWCGATNRFDTANLSGQTCELPPTHRCSACDGTLGTQPLRPSAPDQNLNLEYSHKSPNPTSGPDNPYKQIQKHEGIP